MVGFKALPSPIIGLGRHGGEKSDWSAIYPQFWFDRAVSYLSNQWERGEPTAVIVALYSKQPLSILVYDHAALKDGSVGAGEKAALVRAAFAELFGKTLDPDVPLLDALGHEGYCLCIPDAEQCELVVPHALLRAETLSVDVLFTLEQSAQHPFTTGRVIDAPPLAVSRAQERQILQDATALGGCLSRLLLEAGKAVECTELLSLVAEP